MQSTPTYNEQERIARQLEAVEGRYEELSIRITLPEVISDTALFQKLMREHSDLSELNEIAVQYRKLLNDIEGAREMLEDAGYTVDDRILSSREEVEAFKSEHGVATTPLVFIDDEAVGGSEELAAFLKS